MITVHHLNRSRSTRILWLLEELEVPYEIVRYDRDPKTLLAPPELTRIHPLGKSPVVIDGDDTLAESGAIIEHLADKYGSGKLVPARGTAEHVRYRYFLHYAEGSLMPQLLLKLVFTKVKTAPLPFFVKPIARKIADGVGERVIDPNIKRHVAFLGDALSKSTWLAGEELSGADIQMSYPIEMLVARAGEGLPSQFKAFLDRVHARPAYQRAVEKGGPVDLE